MFGAGCCSSGGVRGEGVRTEVLVVRRLDRCCCAVVVRLPSSTSVCVVSCALSRCVSGGCCCQLSCEVIVYCPLGTKRLSVEPEMRSWSSVEGVEGKSGNFLQYSRQ